MSNLDELCDLPTCPGQKIYSPSRRYGLVVNPVPSDKPGRVEAGSAGQVYALYGHNAPALCFTVERNYPSFPATWIEDHPNGHSYLVTGEDYQGQTVLQLDGGGKRRDYAPEEAAQGHGFCWDEAAFDAPTQILVVSGCHWACPFEFRLYDFSDPMSGWTEIEFTGESLEPVAVLYCSMVPQLLKLDSGEVLVLVRDAQEDCPDDPDHVVAWTVWFRRNNEFVHLQSWIAPEEQSRRVKREADAKAYAADEAKWRASDPLYLAHRERMKNPALSPDGFSGRGITYKGWSTAFTGEDGRWCQRIVTAPSARFHVTLEWGMSAAPIKLLVFHRRPVLPEDGTPVFVDSVFPPSVFWFEHSVDGMNKAYDKVESLLNLK